MPLFIAVCVPLIFGTLRKPAEQPGEKQVWCHHFVVLCLAKKKKQRNEKRNQKDVRNTSR